MVDKKLEEVSNFLKDKISFTFFLVFFSLFLISCERSFENFDKNLLEKKKELEEFNEKSNIRKEEILKSQNENN
jgi:hypothetical protein|tara:strand:- start:143 stop:364 length:222 start_codon:yes stop_codon:yes gene_type:complete